MGGDNQPMSDPGTVLRLALAQVNPTVGDIDGNAALAVEWIGRARDAEADLVLLPELMLSGYPPEDLLLKRHFLAACEEALEALAQQIEGIVAMVGCPIRDVAVHNGLAVIAGGRIAARYRKVHLPNHQPGCSNETPPDDTENSSPPRKFATRRTPQTLRRRLREPIRRRRPRRVPRVLRQTPLQLGHLGVQLHDPHPQLLNQSRLLNHQPRELLKRKATRRHRKQFAAQPEVPSPPEQSPWARGLSSAPTGRRSVAFASSAGRSSSKRCSTNARKIRPSTGSRYCAAQARVRPQLVSSEPRDGVRGRRDRSSREASHRWPGSSHVVR